MAINVFEVFPQSPAAHPSHFFQCGYNNEEMNGEVLLMKTGRQERVFTRKGLKQSHEGYCKMHDETIQQVLPSLGDWETAAVEIIQ